MRILVANLGSTSFKYKLLDMDAGGTEIARGGYERIGQPDSQYKNHTEVVALINQAFATPPDAIGFKAVHGGPISGAVRVTDEVIATMEEFADVAPAHNPRYVAAMREFQRVLPDVPQVAVFETAFHQTIPAARQTYAIPWDWTERFGIRRYGFHGASHRFIAERTLQLLGKDRSRRVISCHLGGSSSVCAIENGKSVANSFGMTPQSGLPHNNRVGDFEVMALTRLFRAGMRLDEILIKLTTESGLLGISGLSSDFREISAAAKTGNGQAQLAIDVFVESVRHYIGAYLVVLGGCDALVFTGGIGENAVSLRQAICRELDFAGVELDEGKNHVRGREEKISAVESDVDIWVIPTNEELIVAEQTVAVLSAN
jgi:acetate kinase